MTVARLGASASGRTCHTFGKRNIAFFLSNLRSGNYGRKFSDSGAPTDASVKRRKSNLAQREFFQTVLGASATKRDAKQFLAKFDQKDGRTKSQESRVISVTSASNARVNLGSLCRPNKAVSESPQFSFKNSDEADLEQLSTLNLAIVKVFETQNWSQKVTEGVAKTLAQLAKLGLRVVVVMEFDSKSQQSEDFKAVLHKCRDFTGILNESNETGAILVNQSFSLDECTNTIHLSIPSLLLSPLRHGSIAVLPPLAQNQNSKCSVTLGNALILALTKFLAGKQDGQEPEWPIEVSLDRIIFLDSAGGIIERSGDKKNHVFVNLMQDFDGIVANLTASAANNADDHEAQRQLTDLQTIRECLELLPATSSALFATPLEVAMSGKRDPHEDSMPGVSTRPQRNTLIHNILTDKPLVSSSLPLARLHGPSPAKTRPPSSTFFKYGMPISIVPDTADHEWTNPGPAGTSLDLRTDTRINLPKLVHLVEDSFGRKLDVDSYLHRVQNHIAGVIVVGDYEGGAILTWEKPTGDRAGRPLVPYLDKFAVLRRCQGSGGVADIVFNAMVRQCFPHGVVWRSRRNNPVNKWYFERSSGTWDLPGSNWTMFWTGNEVEMKSHGGDSSNEWSERWKDYVAVCSNIQPSWADDKKISQ